MPARCFEEPIKNDALENIVTSASSLFYEWLFLVQIRDKIREIRNIYNWLVKQIIKTLQI